MSDKTIKEAWDALTKAMAKDSDWAWSVHCNIAMSISDTIDCSQKDANKAAASVMLHIFHYDVSGYAHYCDIMHAGSVNLNSLKLHSFGQGEDQWYREHSTEECPTESENPKVITKADNRSDPNFTDTARNRDSKTPELAAKCDSQNTTPAPPYAATDIVTPIINPQPPHRNITVY